MVVVTKTVTAAPAVPDPESELAVADEEGLVVDEVEAPIVADPAPDAIVGDDPPPVPVELPAIFDVVVAGEEGLVAAELEAVLDVSSTDEDELVATELEAVKLDDAAGPRDSSVPSVWSSPAGLEACP